MLESRLQKQAAAPVKMPKMPTSRRLPQGFRNRWSNLRPQRELLNRAATPGNDRNKHLMDILKARNGLQTAKKLYQAPYPKWRGIDLQEAAGIGLGAAGLSSLLAGLRGKYPAATRQPTQVPAA